MTDDREASLKRIEEKHNLYKRFFDSDDGREVLADLERDCYFRTTTLSPDPQQTAYREGMRCVLLHIKTLIELNTEDMKNALNQNSDDEPLQQEEKA